jgi:hypothetical protein
LVLTARSALVPSIKISNINIIIIIIIIIIIKSSPVTGPVWPRGFQDVRVRDFHDIIIIIIIRIIIIIIIIIITTTT